MSEKTVATVKLDSPITRGDATITEIVLRKPQSGALRGTRLQAVIFADSLTVDDLVADIATIFHWPPSVTDVMPLTEVLEWRHRAIMRSGASDE
ncbi:phage tail assembly protein [Klebsiella pneumoniae]|nr:phage tail assembly protein [Klebsiella pneumoniae]